MRFLPITLPLTLLTTLFGSSLHADLLVHEQFNYPVSSNLNDANGGLGFSRAWVEANVVEEYDEIQLCNLGFQILAVSGESVRSRAPVSFTTDLIRDTDPLIGTPGRTLWVSFLTRKDSAGGTPPEDYFGLVLYPVFGDGLFIGDPFENDVWSLGIAGTGDALFPSTTPVAPGTTVFLVVKITFAPGADTVRLYVNPTPGGSEPPNSAADAVKSDLNLTDIMSIGVLAGSSTGDPLRSFDEIRIGTTFADVAPAQPGFQEWKVANGFPADANPNSDDDADGASLLVEYGLGMNPQAPARAELPVVGQTTDPTLGILLTLTYTKVRSELSYQVETSTDLVSWSGAEVNQGGTGPAVTATVPFGVKERAFIRLKICAP